MLVAVGLRLLVGTVGPTRSWTGGRNFPLDTIGIERGEDLYVRFVTLLETERMVKSGGLQDVAISIRIPTNVNELVELLICRLVHY
jgi:hypothetical protein